MPNVFLWRATYLQDGAIFSVAPFEPSFEMVTGDTGCGEICNLRGAVDLEICKQLTIPFSLGVGYVAAMFFDPVQKMVHQSQSTEALVRL